MSGGVLVHASCVALAGRGLLILGPSGAGKSALALELMARGAQLVADDGVLLAREGEALVARCPATIRGRIEARGLGLLHAEALEVAPLALAIDLGVEETDRLPPHRSHAMLGVTIPLVHRPQHAHLPAALVQYLKAGRAD